MRYVVIVRREPGTSWVAAETPDEAIAVELAGTFVDAFVLSEDEARLDPDHAAAYGAWRAGDDTAWLHVRDEAEAYEVIQEVWERYLAQGGELPVSEPDDD